jgi:hypothetical protein
MTAPVTKVEIARDPSADERAKWYEKHGVTPNEDGYLDALPVGEAPLNDAGIIEQVRANATRDDVPNLRGSIFQEATMVFVAGGPSLNKFVSEIRAKCADPAYDVYTSNKTCQWMLANGMRPKYHVIIDPMERKTLDLDYEADDVTMVLGLQCHPAVFDEAKARGRKTLKFLAASTTRKNSDVSDAEAAQAAVTPRNPELIAIGGGSMAGTRMIYLAAALGYRRLEFYGLDGCCDMLANGVVNNYAYPKPRGEAVIEVEAANGRKFYSTVSFARQADELVKLLENLPGLDVVIHGDSFMSNQLAMYDKLRGNRSYRISPEYRALQAQMHDTHDRYGVSGCEHASRVFMAGAQIIRKHGTCDILDYGCGKETLRTAMEESFPNIPGMRILGYDPGRPGFDAEPKQAQVVVCTDVMEHIEPECVDAVLRHICELTERVAIIDVALTPAVKTLPDGRNAHICLKSKDWWLSFIKKYFVLIEQASNEQSLLVVGQPIGKWRERLAMKRAA